MTERTESWQKFQTGQSIIRELVEIRESSTPTTHDQRAALNQSAMVFVVTIWEAYIEDVVMESANHLAQHTPKYDQLPKRVRTLIESGVKAQKPKWFVHEVAGDGWRDLVRRNADLLATGRQFNTPKAEKVENLFTDAIGLENVTTSWGWQAFASPGPANRLDETIEIRGDIVHTGRKPEGLAKGWIDTYGNNIRKLVDKTDLTVRSHAAKVTGFKMADFS